MGAVSTARWTSAYDLPETPFATTPCAPALTRQVAAIPTSNLDSVTSIQSLTGVVAAGSESLALIRVNNEPETPFAVRPCGFISSGTTGQQ
jgi:hypothetical protein